MSEPGRSDRGDAGDTDSDEQEAGESEWQRRRRLAAVFGDVLPDTTTDERPTGADPPGRGGEDAWWREQVPPHHGD